MTRLRWSKADVGTYSAEARSGWVSSAQVASISPNRGSWTPLRLSTLNHAGTPRPAYELPTTLYDVLVATPKLAETLSSALATPDAFVEMAPGQG